MAKAAILIISENVELSDQLSAPLEEGYTVEVVETGAEGLARLEAQASDLVIIDVELPDAEGFEYCARLRESLTDPHTALLLCLKAAHAEGRARAYENGADDCLIYPVEATELLAKVGGMIKHSQSLWQLAKANREAQSPAFQSMTESSHYGAVISFFRGAIACTTQDDLATAFFEVMGQFGLSAALEMRGTQTLTLSAPGEACTQVETEMFRALREAGRLYHFGARTMVNDQHCSFLVRNMPVHDEVAYGHMKDIVAIIIEGLQAAVLSIRRNDLIRLLFDELKTIIAEVHQNFGKDDSRVAQALSRLQQTLPDVHSSLHFLDLNPEQESYFEELLDRSVLETETLVSFLNHLQGKLEQLAGRLRLG